MNDIQFNVYALFSSPLSVVQVNEDCSCLNKIITEYEFKKTHEDDSISKESFMTKSVNVIDNFPNTKNILINYFNFYKNKVLKLENQKFQMTTSWATKCLPGGYSQFHSHRNSMYSGVFYFDEVDGGDLQFASYGILPQQIGLQDPSELNILNSRFWTIKPQKNMLVFFPSYLYHRVTKNTSTSIRYSLAFNFFPVGQFGVSSDSSINLSIQSIDIY